MATSGPTESQVSLTHQWRRSQAKEEQSGSLDHTAWVNTAWDTHETLKFTGSHINQIKKKTYEMSFKTYLI